MSASKDASEDFAAMRDDLSALKNDMMRLASSFGSSANEKTRSMTNGVDESAHELYGMVANQGNKAIKTVSNKVDEQPAMALLIAAAIGFFGAKLLSR